jgi:hypothetical protein
MPVQPRRTFAPSFVLTVVGALAVANAAPAEGPKPPTKKVPPAPPKKEPPKTERHWQIFAKDKACFADNSADACPPPPAGKPAPPCNPPVPTKYACPKDMSLPVALVQPAGSLDCFVRSGPMTCPPDMSCNPPPPRKLPCP